MEVEIRPVVISESQLSSHYLHHPICRFIPSKTGIYRNIRHGKYLIIYRIKPERIEVLNIIHGSRSPSKIRAVRKIRI